MLSYLAAEWGSQISRDNQVDRGRWEEGKVTGV